jgi:hypothetical protein
MSDLQINCNLTGNNASNAVASAVRVRAQISTCIGSR